MYGSIIVVEESKLLEWWDTYFLFVHEVVGKWKVTFGLCFVFVFLFGLVFCLVISFVLAYLQQKAG